MERPAKRAKLLSNDGGSEESEGETAGGLTNGFKVNDEYAKRFEHNKKREEKHRLEEKYSKTDGDQDEDEDSEDAESEDDDGELATRDVDDEIFATLRAIKSKDPRVYDKDVNFYKEYDGDAPNSASTAQKEAKPVFLHDYHRQNLLAGYTGEENDESEAMPRTYDEEQDALRRKLVDSMHSDVQPNGLKNEQDDEEDDLLHTKSVRKPNDVSVNGVHPSRARHITDNDVATADKDPETFLSNFMAARAWVPNETSRWQPFDSDDSDEEKRADDFEEAYNMRFEDPSTANEKLQSFSRGVGKYSVRRDEQGGRKRARDREKEAKEAAKREREEERGRLRKLKIEEAEEKIKRIKDAAGLKGQEIDVSEWKDIIDGDFEDDAWEKEMHRRFGEEYYAEDDRNEASEEEAANAKDRRKKVKKPKWDDDIAIDDLIPDFEKDDGQPQFTLSSDEEADIDLVEQAEDEASDPEDDAALKSAKKNKTKKDRVKAKAEAKRTARRERRQVEELVDSSLPLSHPALATTSTKAPAIGFKYRDTSPTSFGLSAKDILYADDSQLNQYAGLKKMAAFRDDDKKRKDRKRYSKKARLREWRKETFGNVDGVKDKIQKPVRESNVDQGEKGKDGQIGQQGGRNVVDGERKRKRKKQKKEKPALDVAM